MATDPEYSDPPVKVRITSIPSGFDFGDSILLLAIAICACGMWISANSVAYDVSAMRTMQERAAPVEPTADTDGTSR